MIVAVLSHVNARVVHPAALGAGVAQFGLTTFRLLRLLLVVRRRFLLLSILSIAPVELQVVDTALVLTVDVFLT